MNTFLKVLLVIWHLTPTETYPQSGPDDPCSFDHGYPNGNICCLNCPAGTRMTSPCTRNGQRGQCEECDDGTYTEHGNGLKQCFKCTQCRPDQEIVKLCTHTQDTECQCKVGRFCDPEQACEVCKKCSRCEKDEEVVRNCTSTTNTECKKTKPPNTGPATAKAYVIVPLVLALAVVVIGIIVFLWKRRHHRKTDSERNLPDRQKLKSGQHYSNSCSTDEKGNGETRRPSCSNLILNRQLVRAKSTACMEDERKVLCESLSSSASNSQHSLSAFPAPPPRASPMVPRQPNRREDEPFPKLVAVNGEESLRKCFEYFEEIDFDYHKRFFRQLGINDNVIKSKEHLLYEDKMHELLNIWVEKEGREGTLNDLLKALLDLNQRRTAETVKEKAVHNGHYFCDD